MDGSFKGIFLPGVLQSAQTRFPVSGSAIQAFSFTLLIVISEWFQAATLAIATPYLGSSSDVDSESWCCAAVVSCSAVFWFVVVVAGLCKNLSQLMATPLFLAIQTWQFIEQTSASVTNSIDPLIHCFAGFSLEVEGP